MCGVRSVGGAAAVFFDVGRICNIYYRIKKPYMAATDSGGVVCECVMPEGVWQMDEKGSVKDHVAAEESPRRSGWRYWLEMSFYGIMYVAVAISAFGLAYKFSDGMEMAERAIAIFVTTSLGVLVTALVLPPVVNFGRAVFGGIVNQLFRMPVQDIISAVAGLIIGLVIASLLNTVVGKINIIGPYVSMVSLIFFSYMGMIVSYRKRNELWGWMSWRGGKAHGEEHTAGRIGPKVLDTSVIIDGRIADICRAGFLEGELVVANFVLDELRHIADLPDFVKRNRGRRGLDILNRMQKEMPGRVVISDVDFPDVAEVDNKLLRLAQQLDGSVVTNDFNLAQVAQVQGVRVLNINELSNALKAVLLPGENFIVDVIHAGKENNQGVAYLDDGTMVVVENGRQYIGKRIRAEVSSVLQTTAGRMIFARALDNVPEGVQ